MRVHRSVPWPGPPRERVTIRVCTAFGHWSWYWNAVSAPSDDEWTEGLTEDGDKLFLKDKLLVPESQVEELIDHWH